MCQRGLVKPPHLEYSNLIKVDHLKNQIQARILAKIDNRSCVRICVICNTENMQSRSWCGVRGYFFFVFAVIPNYSVSLNPLYCISTTITSTCSVPTQQI